MPNYYVRTVAQANGHLHKKISQEFINENGEDEFYSIFKESSVININYTDIDFRTDEIKNFDPTDDQLDGNSLKYDAYWDKDFLSVGDFTESEDNPNISFLVKKIKQALDSNGKNSIALGAPNFEVRFTTEQMICFLSSLLKEEPFY